MPGISPFQANSRKQILHMAKRLKNPFERPQSRQRLYFLDENFGLRNDLIINPFLAI